ncbi:hypothetical protein L6164_021892 [Bauhinia variegata]|uniref:Uncharacterized protein n=1 Tax=Bauhinia variegata TaxID=167791 RepID=A0ACB9MGR2_BAUVA|nr:hypothetical protein L6164_021892 [Bauhinia variegata]
MEELGVLWNYQEPFDELNQQIAYANFEVESLEMQLNEKLKMKRDLNEKLKNSREQLNNLFNLVTVSYQEREELRSLVLSKFLPLTQGEVPNTIAQAEPESLTVNPTKANSSITESNSFSHGSPPVDSIFEPVSSSEFSNNMRYVNQSLAGVFNCSAPPALVSSVKPNTDPWDNVIDSIAMGKGLPQKGKLLQAVMDAGPLLQTIIVSGPLPRWRNPPPQQPIKIPPFTVKEFEIPKIELKTVPDTPTVISRTNLQHCSAATLNFAATPSPTWNNASHFASNACFSSNHNQVPSNKRQRRHSPPSLSVNGVQQVTF